MVAQRVSFSLALALSAVSAAACAPSVTIAEEDAKRGEAGEPATGGTGNNDGSGGSSGGGGTGGPLGGTAGTGTGGPEVTPIYLYDENNHVSEVSFSIPIVETASGVDLDVCWTDATSDLTCAEVDPRREIEAVEMIRFRTPNEQDVARLLAMGELSQESLDGYVSVETDRVSTCTSLSSLTNFGTVVDVSEEYVDGGFTYLFGFNRSTSPANGWVTMVFARPSASSENTRLDAPPGCNVRTVTANLTTIEPVNVPFEGPWIVDFSNVTLDAQGNPFASANIDSVTLWFVAGGTPSNLQERTASLDSIATESYGAEHAGGRSVNLSQLSNLRDGRPFSTFRTDEVGIWLFGLRCTVCMHDLPQVLAIFEPVEAP
jgi:hypothetical protein